MKDYKTEIKKRRDFLKAHDFDVIPIEEWWDPDSMKGVPQPPLQKPYDSDAGLISLVDPKDFSIGLYSVIDAFIIFMWREYVLYCHRID